MTSFKSFKKATKNFKPNIDSSMLSNNTNTEEHLKILKDSLFNLFSNNFNDQSLYSEKNIIKNKTLYVEKK